MTRGKAGTVDVLRCGRGECVVTLEGSDCFILPSQGGMIPPPIDEPEEVEEEPVDEDVAAMLAGVYT